MTAFELQIGGQPGGEQPMPSRSGHNHTLLIRPAALALAAATLAGCSGIERTDRADRPDRANLAAAIEVPLILQGTISSEAMLDGNQPIIVHGYGLVVGLNGTGSADIPPAVRGHMIAMASRHGIGRPSSGWGSLSPDVLLDSSDTAVVVVEGVIPPAATEKARFDVRVFAYPTSGTTSLERGRLYTTDLVPASRPDVGRRVLPPTGSRTPAALATAGGPLFINPFASPGSFGSDDIDRRTGLILNGGTVIKDIPLKLRLVTPSHTRAAVIQNALNTRFSQEPGQRDPTARGESDESIEITVPPSFRDKTEDFVQLIQHTTIRQAGTERIAATISRYVQENPAVARAASWRWEALGPRALPIVRDLYDIPAELPRLAALRAGAFLDDPLVTTHLITMARSSSLDTQYQSIRLLAGMGTDPRIDLMLRELLNADDFETRIEAYEALVERRAPSVGRLDVDGNFVLDVVASINRMVYITQVGMPRIVVFGTDLAVKRPCTVVIWSGQLMIRGDLDKDDIEVYYRPRGAMQGSTYWVGPRLTELVSVLGRATIADNPQPGLGLSYSEVVSVLYQIWRQGYLEADFRPEQDRVLAAILRQRRRELVTERPEFDTDVETPTLSPAGTPPAPTDDGSDHLDSPQ